MKFFIAGMLLSLPLFAQENQFQCQATYNADKILEQEVTVKAGQRNLSFGEAQGFEFFLTSSDQDVIELQALNIYEPSRSYATAKIRQAGDFVQLSVWKREFIMEVICIRL